MDTWVVSTFHYLSVTAYYEYCFNKHWHNRYLPESLFSLGVLSEVTGAHLHCCWYCELVQSFWKTVWSFLKKLKILPLCNPAIWLLNIYLRKIMTLIWKVICIPVFNATLFTIAILWKQPKCPWIEEWINKMWYMKYYSARKRKCNLGICNNMDGSRVYCAQWSKSDRQILHDFTYMRYLKIKQMNKTK